MTPCKSPISTCRYCQFYQPEGLHGGSCQQLNVSVRGEWTACSLSMPAFTPNWTGVEEMAHNWDNERDSVIATDVDMEDIAIVNHLPASPIGK